MRQVEEELSFLPGKFYPYFVLVVEQAAWQTIMLQTLSGLKVCTKQGKEERHKSLAFLPLQQE